jgi:hypothetical protein
MNQQWQALLDDIEATGTPLAACNPSAHSDLVLHDRLIGERRGPDGKVVQRIEREGNLILDNALNDLCAGLATGTAAFSTWANYMALGAGTTPVAHDQVGLIAGRQIVAFSGRATGTPAQVQYFANFPPDGNAYEVQELLIAKTNSMTTGGIGRLLLGAQSMPRGASDTIGFTYIVQGMTAVTS